VAGEHDRSRADPFAGQSPDTARDYGRAPSDLSTAPPADRVRPLDGQQARYRLAIVAMEVPGLPTVAIRMYETHPTTKRSTLLSTDSGEDTA